MKVVFVGAGRVFGFHASQFEREAPQDSEFFVVEPDDYLAEKSGFDRVSLEEAVRIADVAIIMTPSYLRWEIAKGFISKKTPIVVEKPLTIRWEEIGLFREASANSWICPILNIRAIPTIEKMHENRGTPTLIRCSKTRSLTQDYYSGWHGKYATDGGVLAQQGFHCLDLACWFGGVPVSVKAMGERRKFEMECEDTAHVKIVFENGGKGLVDCTTAGEKVAVNAEIAVTDEKGTKESSGFMFAQSGGTGHARLAKLVFSRLKKGEPPPITVESAIPAIQALHASYVSMDQGGESVKVGVPHPKLGKGSL